MLANVCAAARCTAWAGCRGARVGSTTRAKCLLHVPCGVRGSFWCALVASTQPVLPCACLFAGIAPVLAHIPHMECTHAPAALHGGGPALMRGRQWLQRRRDLATRSCGKTTQSLGRSVERGLSGLLQDWIGDQPASRVRRRPRARGIGFIRFGLWRRAPPTGSHSRLFFTRFARTSPTTQHIYTLARARQAPHVPSSGRRPHYYPLLAAA